MIMRQHYYLVRTKKGFIRQIGEQKHKYTKQLEHAQRFPLNKALHWAIKLNGKTATVEEWYKLEKE